MKMKSVLFLGVLLSVSAEAAPPGWEQELRQWNHQLTHASSAPAVEATPVILAAATDSTPQSGASQSDTLRWTVQVTPTHPQPGDTVELVFTADIASGWILYSSDFSADIGPRPARFSFESTPGLELVDGVRAVKPLRRTDKTWKAEYAYFERRAEFRQKVKLTAPVTTIAGRIDGQTCFEENGLCQLFRKTFTTSLE
jgi:thiol:disulfide interchange protein DsbD